MNVVEMNTIRQPTLGIMIEVMQVCTDCKCASKIDGDLVLFKKHKTVHMFARGVMGKAH